jgi:hypothetical protein
MQKIEDTQLSLVAVNEACGKWMTSHSSDINQSQMNGNRFRVPNDVVEPTFLCGGSARPSPLDKNEAIAQDKYVIWLPFGSVELAHQKQEYRVTHALYKFGEHDI